MVLLVLKFENILDRFYIFDTYYCKTLVACMPTGENLQYSAYHMVVVRVEVKKICRKPFDPKVLDRSVILIIDRANIGPKFD